MYLIDTNNTNKIMISRQKSWSNWTNSGNFQLSTQQVNAIVQQLQGGNTFNMLNDLSVDRIHSYVMFGLFKTRTTYYHNSSSISSTTEYYLSNTARRSLLRALFL
jgi:hypothetical protein